MDKYSTPSAYVAASVHVYLAANTYSHDIENSARGKAVRRFSMHRSKKTGLTYWIAYSPFCLVNERIGPPSRIMSSLMIRHVRHNPILLKVSHSTVGTTQSKGKCRLKSKTLVFQTFYKGTRRINVKFYARKSEARALQEMDPLGFISVFWARALIMSNGEITLRKY